MKLTLIFPKLKNVDLLKDMGFIPYLLEKNHQFKTNIVSYKNDIEYPYLDNEVKNLSVEFIKKSPFSLYRYILKNYKDIDVLMLVHISTETIYLSLLYKYLKPNGYVYIKGDMSTLDYATWGKRFFLTQAKRVFLYKLFIKKINLLSYENRKTEKYLCDIPKEKILHMPNGFYEPLAHILNIQHFEFIEKENIILFVARHGDYAKNSELLLEAISKIDNLYTWKILFIGEMTKEFEILKNDLLNNTPLLAESVFFLGNISDKSIFYGYFNCAKVLILTSRWEGFPLVAIEGLYFSNMLLLSDSIFSVSELTDEGKVGLVFKGDDVTSLVKNLENILSGNINLELESKKSFELFDRKLRWESLVSTLNDKIKKDMS